MRARRCFDFLSALLLFRFPRPQNRQVRLRGRLDSTIIALSSPAPDSLSKLRRSKKNKTLFPNPQSIIFSQSLLSHPPPWTPFLFILILVSFQFDLINPTFRHSPRSMTSMASTKTQLLARWRAIEEEDETGHGTHMQPHRFQQLKEEWYVFCFSSISSTLHFLHDSHFSEFILVTLDVARTGI